jgi:hypothetical protein
MLNITKIEGGFIMNNSNYLFENFNEMPYEIISSTQVHIGTNEGVILLDLSVTINEQSFTDINVFVDFLFN